MDDNFGFGTSVWDTPAESSTSKLSLEASFPSFPTRLALNDLDDTRDLFDEEDFDAPVEASADGDDFGDFGDFGEGIDAGDSTIFSPSSPFGDGGRQCQPTANGWESLHLDHMPSSSELKERLDDLLGPLSEHIDPSEITSTEDIRQVEGLSQILVTPESRSLYNSLFNSLPSNIRPPNWTRSRIRRQHLTSLGIPVNLDEVLPHANGRPLPALHITTRPSSAPPGPRNSFQSASHANASGNNSRAGTPRPTASGKAPTAVQHSFGARPEVDEARVSRMLSLSPDTLPLLPLATLESHLATIRSLTASTSSLLTHLLQTRDALQQDSETYNGLIAELVGEAQKMKSGAKSRSGIGKRGSGIM